MRRAAVAVVAAAMVGATLSSIGSAGAADPPVQGRYSLSSSMTPSQPVAGATAATGTRIWVFAQVSGITPTSVDFFIDGSWWRRDTAAPYTLQSHIYGLDPADIGTGTHTLRVRANTATTSYSETASFVVGTPTSTTTTTAPSTTTTTAPTTTTTTQPPTTTTLPPAPGTRNAFQWPFATTSPWNTPIGSGAAYSSASDPRTTNLISTAYTAWINASQYSMPLYTSTSSDPLRNVTYTWGTSTYGTLASCCNGTTSYRIPSTATAAAGTDRHLHVVAPDGRTLHETWNFGGTAPNNTAGKYARFDLHGSGIGTTNGTNWGTRAYGGAAIAGTIRTWEINAGAIRHALSLALVNNQLKRGWVWPATSEDSGAASYAGQVPMGSLVAIPGSVNLSTLGLSTRGLVLARALQDYGAYVVDRSGSFTFYAEPNAESLLSAMRNDLNKIRAQLRLVTNNGPSSVGGGGTPRVAPAPALS